MTQRIALITGASRGIGKAISERYKKEGWRVLIPTRDELDLLNLQSIEFYFSKIQALNVLINNAGINPIAHIDQVNNSEIDEVVQTNLVAPLLTMKFAFPLMKRTDGVHRVVNISSIWAALSKPGRVVYSMTKSGITGLTRTAAIEWAKEGILVNSVAPGFTDTELTRRNNNPEQISQIESVIPVGRMADPSEIAELVYFLASEHNTYITGQTILIDGGYSCI